MAPDCFRQISFCVCKTTKQKRVSVVLTLWRQSTVLWHQTRLWKNKIGCVPPAPLVSSPLMKAASILLIASLGRSQKVWGRPSAEGASRVEEPQAPREEWCGEGCPPPHWERGLGRGTPQKIFFRFLISKQRLLVHCGGYFYGLVDCFGCRQPLRDSDPMCNITVLTKRHVTVQASCLPF